MKAMILAAGYGERMRPISERRPKALLPVLGKPLIDYVIDKLAAASINQIAVNTHYGSERVVHHLCSASPPIVDLLFSHEPRIKGTGGGMRGVRDFLAGSEPFLVHNGDIFSTVHLDDVVRFHTQQAPLVTLVLHDHPPINTVSVSPSGEITDFARAGGSFRPRGGRALTFTGISVVDPAVLDLIPDTVPCSIIDIYRQLVTERPGCICGFVPEHAYWIDVGTPAAYLQVHRDILLRAAVPGLGENAAGPIFQERGSTIHSAARLNGFLSLGKNCHVEAGACVTDCVVWDNTVIASGTAYENGVIDGAWFYQVNAER